MKTTAIDPNVQTAKTAKPVKTKRAKKVTEKDITPVQPAPLRAVPPKAPEGFDLATAQKAIENRIISGAGAPKVAPFITKEDAEKVKNEIANKKENVVTNVAEDVKENVEETVKDVAEKTSKMSTKTKVGIGLGGVALFALGYALFGHSSKAQKKEA